MLNVDDDDFAFALDDNAIIAQMLSEHPSMPSPQVDVGNFRDCKVLFSLTSATGISPSSSWRDDYSGYSAVVKLNDDEKEFKLSYSAEKDMSFTAKASNPDSSTWDTFDYYGQSKVVFTLKKKRWFATKTLGSFSISMNELLQQQMALAMSQKGQVHKGRQQWCFDDSIQIHLPTKGNKDKTWKNSSKSARALQSKSAMMLSSKHFSAEEAAANAKPSAKAAAAKQNNIVTLNFQFRIVFLKHCLETVQREDKMWSDFHLLAALAPGPIIADIMKALAAKGILNRALTLLTSDGYNALDIALLKGNAAAVSTLLQRAGRLAFRPLTPLSQSLSRPLTPSRQQLQQHTVLHCAVLGGSTDCLDLLRRFLRKYGGIQVAWASAEEMQTMQMSSLLSSRDQDGHTPLTLACSIPFRDQQVFHLMMAGAEFGAVNQASGYTALMYACALGSSSIVSTLLSVIRSEQELLANISGSEVHSEDALSRHIRSNARSRRLVLGREGQDSASSNPGLALSCYTSDPAHKDALGRQAMHIAVLRGHSEIVQQLLHIGVSLTVQDNQGDNAFHLLAGMTTNDSNTLLFAHELVKAEKERWHSYVHTVRPQGLDLMVRGSQALLALNNSGLSPAEVAALQGHLELAALLLEEGLAIYTPQHLSASQLQRIDRVRERLEHTQQLLGTSSLASSSEHKSSLPEEKSSEAGGCSSQSNSSRELAEADRLDYIFSLTYMSAKAAGLESP